MATNDKIKACDTCEESKARGKRMRGRAIANATAAIVMRRKRRENATAAVATEKGKRERDSGVTKKGESNKRAVCYI